MEEKKKHIDELFKAGLTGSEVPFDEANWAAMEQKLNSKRTKRLVIIWYSAIGAAAAVILVVVGLLGLPERQSRPTPTQATQQTKSLPENKTPQVEKKLAETAQTQPTNRMAISKITFPAQPTAKLRLSLTNSVKREAIARLSIALPTDLQSSFALPPAAKVRNETFPEVEQKSKAKVVHNAVNRTPVLSILAAPDLTNVQGAGNPQFSPNLGILVTVPLTRKWSVSSGLLYARKNYNSPFSFYKPNSNYVWAARPEQVNANCDVLDVPIDLNYELLSKQKTSVKVSGGLSSYFMLREQYHFIYNSTETYETNLPTSFEVRGRNQHILGVGNLAISVEQQINPKMSIGVRPFIKLPLTEIGWGQSKLQSTGVAVSVNFHLGKK